MESANLENHTRAREYRMRWISSVLLKGRNFLIVKCFPTDLSKGYSESLLPKGCLKDFNPLVW